MSGTASHNERSRAASARSAPLVLAVALAALGGALSAQEQRTPYEIKAGLLFNFGRYVRWPDAAFADGNSPFVIGILGEDPFQKLLDEGAKTRKLADRPVVVKHFKKAGDVTDCHILFVVGSSDPEKRRAILADADKIVNQKKNTHTLLVGETEGLAERGFDFNFFIEADRVKFEINRKAIQLHKLEVDSQVLRMGKIVVDTK